MTTWPFALLILLGGLVAICGERGRQTGLWLTGIGIATGSAVLLYLYARAPIPPAAALHGRNMLALSGLVLGLLAWGLRSKGRRWVFWGGCIASIVLSVIGVP